MRWLILSLLLASCGWTSRATLSDNELCRSVCQKHHGSDFYDIKGSNPEPTYDLGNDGQFCICSVRVRVSILSKHAPERESP